TGHLEALDSTLAAAALRDFADVLTNWYVRRSRDRFWQGVDAEGRGTEAFDTLFTVLETVCRVAAPLLPLMTEEIWQGLTGGRSVHLADWPDAAEFPSDAGLVAAMDEVRSVCSAASSLRKANKLRNRLPLQRLTVALPSSAHLAEFADIIRDEVNVKEVVLTDDVNSVGRFEVVVNARAAGPRLGKDVQRVIRAVKSGDYTVSGSGAVTAAGIELVDGEYSRKLVAVDPERTAEIPGTEGLVVLDMTLTEELEAEGWAADRIRGIQDARRTEDFDVSDRISLVLSVPEERRGWADTHIHDIASEVLATSAKVITGEVLTHDTGDGCTATVARVTGD
ncbi:class I tRNA ligase family protein, partial [uncultured Corynebacterium sp.]|uniref:class I tRNA ligase family protein n=1 Tax=uncultured Corynebacterium sp. TaxID=159447 RepID=UPI0025EE65DF